MPTIRYWKAINESGRRVIVEFPYADGRRGKNRPSLVIQNDRDNSRLANTVVAMISGNTRPAAEPTQVLIDPRIESGAESGLNGVSAVKCCNLFTVRQQDIIRRIGRLSDSLLGDVNRSLKHALGLA
jgi:mRNA-degrading endonuclease toxin of MazEF toxin-antitoxin module